MTTRNKFNRETQRLKTRAVMVRGALHKGKGAFLTDEEADTLSDEVISDEIDLGTFEVHDKEPVEPAEGETPAGGEGEAEEGQDKKSAEAKRTRKADS